MNPSGIVRIVRYENTRLGIQRSAWMYTPPYYQRRSAFPVVYLLASPGDPAFQWAFIECANDMLNRVSVDDAVTPTIVVIPMSCPLR